MIIPILEWDFFKKKILLFKGKWAITFEKFAYSNELISSFVTNPPMLFQWITET